MVWAGRHCCLVGLALGDKLGVGGSDLGQREN